MLVQRLSAIAVCSALLTACSTNNTARQANIPVADPLNSRVTHTTTYITRDGEKMTAAAYKKKQQQEQKLAAQRRQWEQEHTRRQQEAQQEYEVEKQRIARQKYHEKWKADQLRKAQAKLDAEKLRLTKLKYQREWEAKQEAAKLARQEREIQQRQMAQQRAAEQQRQQQAAAQQRAEQQRQQQLLAQKRAKYHAEYQQQQAQRQQQVTQRRPTQHVNLQPATTTAAYRGPGRYTRLPDTVASNLRLRGVSERGMSAYIRPASGRGPAILTAAADTPRNPASTMKLVTTYAALGTLGPNYRWPTELYTNGRIVGGTLHGDVIIKGYGNPDLDESDLRQMLTVLRNKGVRNIAGNLVTDLNYFQIPYERPGAFDGRAQASYNAQPEALLYQGRGSNYKFRSLAKKVRRSSGKSPNNKLARGDLNTNLFGAFWKVWVGQLNGNIQGDLKRGSTPQGAQLVFRHQSKPLREIVRTVNKDSNNVMARQIMLTLGAEVMGAPGTPQKGAAAIGRFLESRGLRFPELRIENGSGLSRIAKISSRNLGEMLVNAYNSPWRNDYMNSLPVLGVDGTLKNRMRRSGLAGRGRFKTGTLRNVRGLAGYVQAADGQTYVLSILHNDPKARSKARNAHDELVKWTYYGPRSNFASSQ